MARPFSIRKLFRGTHAPLSVEQLADVWAQKNVRALTEIAMRSMLDPPGTAYEVPPFRIIVFESADARILYQLKLHKATEAYPAERAAEHALCQHVEELVLWGRAQVVTRVAVRAIFQRDDSRGSDQRRSA